MYMKFTINLLGFVENTAFLLKISARRIQREI